MTKFQKLRDRLDILEKEQIERDKWILARRPANFVPNDWSYTTDSHNHFFFSVCDYILRHDIAGFREHLRQSALCRKRLFEIRNRGEKVDDSYLSMNNFQYVLKALAAGDFVMAKEFVTLMGGRDEIEKANDHPFDRALGYALKGCILDDREMMKHWLPIAMRESQRDSDVQKLIGYAEGLLAIYDHDEQAFEAAMKHINEDHKKLCRYAGLFELTPQSVINVWALGLQNLARHKGMDVQFVDEEYLPQELII